MNSKQLNFFTVPEDLPSIYSFFNARGIKYIGKSTEGQDNIHLKTFPYSDGEIYEQIYLTSEDFRSNIYLPSSEEEQLFPVDLYKSYVLEFAPASFYPASKTTLHRGRFYCITSYLVSNGESVAKSEEFKLWVDGIFKQFKREFLKKYDDRVSIFFSPGTIDWMETNKGTVDKAFWTITI